MCDSWTHNGTHYVSILASYTKLHPVVINGRKKRTILCCPLMAVISMARVNLDKEPDDCTSSALQQTSKFSAQIYTRSFGDIFHVYEADVKWVDINMSTP